MLFQNSTLGKSSGRDRLSTELNHHLETIKMRVMQIHRELEFIGANFTAQDVISGYLGRSRHKRIMLIKDVYQPHNDKCEQLEGRDFAPGTVERYRTCLKHTVEFMQHAYNKSDIAIEEVNHKFITDYEDYFKIVRKCSHNTTTKYLKNFNIG